jgi:phospholipid/cholesterol/gamma-HCH transport system ATP-binding protein
MGLFSARKRPEVAFTQPAKGEELIRFEGLFKAFGAKKIYEGLDLTVQAGETLTVIGGSGTGKSVLLKCLIGLLSPDAGTITFEGVRLDTLPEEDFLAVRRKVAMVFQGAALFDSLSVGENIAYPLREHFPDLSEEELSARVAHKLALVNLPGIEAMRPSDLSGGMRKRVGLARAIATDPEVILWDEPTTGLDPISTRVIDELIHSMQAKLGCTSIVVTHDMESAFNVSDLIAMLANRRIVQVGTVEEMRASPLKEVRAFFDARVGPRRSAT